MHRKKLNVLPNPCQRGIVMPIEKMTLKFVIVIWLLGKNLSLFFSLSFQYELRVIVGHVSSLSVQDATRHGPRLRRWKTFDSRWLLPSSWCVEVCAKIKRQRRQAGRKRHESRSHTFCVEAAVVRNQSTCFSTKRRVPSSSRPDSSPFFPLCPATRPIGLNTTVALRLLPPLMPLYLPSSSFSALSFALFARFLFSFFFLLFHVLFRIRRAV